MMNKDACRNFLRAKRRQFSMAKRLSAGRDATHWLADSPLFAKSVNISVYIAVNDEFDCTPLIHLIWKAGKQCFLPVLSTTKDRKLIFLPYQKNDTLEPNCYGIPEPIKGESFPVEKLDMILLPLVGFDGEGRRLGMGAGYYDQTLAFLKDALPGRPRLIGSGFAAQEVPRLPEDPWDIRLDGVLTEEGLRFFTSQEGS